MPPPDTPSPRGSLLGLAPKKEALLLPSDSDADVSEKGLGWRGGLLLLTGLYFHLYTLSDA